MKSLAYISVLVAAVCLVAGVVEKFEIAVLLPIISPIGYVKASMIALLFGINFALLEIAEKR